MNRDLKINYWLTLFFISQLLDTQEAGEVENISEVGESDQVVHCHFILLAMQDAGIRVMFLFHIFN